MGCYAVITHYPISGVGLNCYFLIYVTGSKCEEQIPYVNDNLHSAILKNEPSSPHPDLALNPASKSEIAEQSSISVSHAQPPAPPRAAANYSGVDSSGEGQAHNGRPRDRNQLLPRYWPKISDQELQQISEEYPCINLLNVISFTKYMYNA